MKASLPMTCTEFDAEEIKRLGKRFKKLVFIESINNIIWSVIQILIGSKEKFQNWNEWSSALNLKVDYWKAIWGQKILIT